MKVGLTKHQQLWFKSKAAFTVVMATGILTACDSNTNQSSETASTQTSTPAVATVNNTSSNDYPTEAYFGDSHVHTGWSADAGMDGAITGPEDAYRLAIGEEIKSNTGQPVKLQQPYDWFLVSDHSDGMGTINEIISGHPEMMVNPILKGWNEAFKSGSEEAAANAKSELIVMQ